jgi:hypothetical protein
LSAQWVQKQNLSGNPRSFSTAFSIDSTSYIVGGSDNNGTLFDDVWAYNPSTDSWTQKANFPGGFRSASTAFTIGNKGYLGTGVDGANYLDDFWEYNPITDTWLQKANFPGGAREEAVGFSIGNKGYMGTGQIFVTGPNSSFTATFNDFYEYNPANDTWVQKANLPGPERAYAVGGSIGNKGYLGLGGNDDQSLSYNDFYEYDPISDVWNTKASMPSSGRADAGILSTPTKIYVIGGINFPSFSGFSSCQMFDPLTNLWSFAPTFGGAVIIAPVVVNINGKGYVGTGFNYALTIRKDWWEFTPSIPTGFEDNEKVKFITYPNPVTDKLTIENDDFHDGEFTAIEIFGVTGKTVLKQMVSNSPNGRIIVDVSLLAHGTYMLILQTDKRILHKFKFVH